MNHRINHFFTLLYMHLGAKIKPLHTYILLCYTILTNPNQLQITYSLLLLLWAAKLAMGYRYRIILFHKFHQSFQSFHHESKILVFLNLLL